MRQANSELVTILTRAGHLSKNSPSFLTAKEVEALEGDVLKIAEEQHRQNLINYFSVNYRSNSKK